MAQYAGTRGKRVREPSQPTNKGQRVVTPAGHRVVPAEPFPCGVWANDMVWAKSASYVAPPTPPPNQSARHTARAEANSVRNLS